jgi:hypothetical protein
MFFKFKETEESKDRAFSLIPKGIKWQRHGGHVGVPNKDANEKYFVGGTPTWLRWRHVKTLYSFQRIQIISKKILCVNIQKYIYTNIQLFANRFSLHDFEFV